MFPLKLSPGKHFDQHRRYGLGCSRRDVANLFQQALPIHGAELIEGNFAGLATKR
jgi:hypothetical protein